MHEAVRRANIHKNDIDLIAYTRGPGLLGSLLVGSSLAKGLALALNKPLIDVHHMEAHVLAHFIENADWKERSAPEFPFLCLTVSGGHTQLLRVNGPTSMEILGETMDDAAGEAFDKGAKMMGLPYPGGPQIDALARTGNAESFHFPVPKTPDLHFSFSGLKTSLLYLIRKHDADWVETHKADLAASYQASIVETLMQKLQEAVKQTGIRNVVIAGGVSANSGIRDAVEKLGEDEDLQVRIPRLAYCTDNGAMIAMAGLMAYAAGRKGDFNQSATARWPMTQGSFTTKSIR